MCWNAAISLNTFAFSSFVLLGIIYNNAYTQYKIKELNNIWVYFLFASVILMQLIEFFIWRNLNNKVYNNVFSTIAILLLIIQPMLSLMIVTNKKLRNILLVAYLLLAIPYSIYNFGISNIHSTVGKNGHLRWNFFKVNSIIPIVWVFFFLFSFVYEKRWFGAGFGLVTLTICYFNYKNDNTIWSMWCWAINSIMIFYAFYLLIWLPFLEKNSIS